MSYPVYYVEKDDTLPHLINSWDVDTGESSALTGLIIGDIKVYKDGGLTERSSTNGFTVDMDFDTHVGVNGITLDLSDNSDAGFYTVGSWYHVVLSDVVVDGQTIRFCCCAFKIVSLTRGMAGTALPAAAADAAGGLPISDAGSLDLDIQGDATLAKQDTLLARVGAITGSGNNTLLGFFIALMDKAGANPSNITGTFNPATDSMEAIRDNQAGADVGAVADAVWEHLLLAGDTAGSASKILQALMAGIGAIAWSYVVTDSVTSDPISDVEVWATSDLAGSNMVASGTTDVLGEVIFQLDAGTYYFWSQKAGTNFTNPDTEVVA